MGVSFPTFGNTGEELTVLPNHRKVKMDFYVLNGEEKDFYINAIFGYWEDANTKSFEKNISAIPLNFILEQNDRQEVSVDLDVDFPKEGKRRLVMALSFKHVSSNLPLCLAGGYWPLTNSCRIILYIKLLGITLLLK